LYTNKWKNKFYFRKYYSHSNIFWDLRASGIERSCSKLLTTGWMFLQISFLKCRKCFSCIVLVVPCKYSNNPLLRKVNNLNYFLCKSYNLHVLHKLRFQIHKHIDPNCLTFTELGYWQYVIGGQNSLILFSLLPIDSPTLCCRVWH